MAEPDDIQLAEDYLQISPNILETFPRDRAPVDLYILDEGIGNVRPLYHKGDPLGGQRYARILDHCRDEQLFLYRKDYREYAQHLSKRLGLVLVESDLNDREVAEIFFLALHYRLVDFFDQPMQGRLRDLKRDLSILSEFLWIDPVRTDFLCHNLDKHNDLATHAVNCTFIGLGLYAMHYRKKVGRLNLTHMALGLALHDLGMTMVPESVKEKEGVLLHRDKEALQKHPDLAMGMLKRLKVDDQIVEKCVMEHHERLDGSGYPARLSGERISVPGRVCALADSFCAGVEERSFRSGKNALEVAASLVKQDSKYDVVLARKLYELVECGFEGCRTR
ncbi:HD-GYP domain-containing protein [Salidesulfovibrio onnuriiensis]|uniref:HD-GYP domain-containing protein n=1 Tax=Salidesulfovibrio onnuriiensis TaxID=2583823 RepID=UPI0016506FE2|nr:HD domain-containing phosphohydrolase [Salidesulfovibrio onnuriiensis]